MTPNEFHGNEKTSTILDEIDSTFERLCLMMEEKGTFKAKELTVFEFQSRLDYLIEMNKPKQEES